MTTPIEAWSVVLADATAATQDVTGREALVRAGEALRLAWATGGLVRADAADDELWWLRLAEAIANAADDLDLLPGAPAVLVGTGPAPAAELPDDPTLRQLTGDLLEAVRDALHGYAGQNLSGPETAAAALAWRSAARAASAGRT
jgi:hypothetical protein